jgi:hypothetical protein
MLLIFLLKSKIIFQKIGISVDEQKPNTDVFFNSIVIQLKRLELGIRLEIDNIVKNRKFFVIAAVFDKPAKSSILYDYKYDFM